MSLRRSDTHPTPVHLACLAAHHAICANSRADTRWNSAASRFGVRPLRPLARKEEGSIRDATIAGQFSDPPYLGGGGGGGGGATVTVTVVVTPAPDHPFVNENDPGSALAAPLFVSM